MWGLNPSVYIGLVVRYLFWPLWAPIYDRGWAENDCFYGKDNTYKAGSRVRDPTWKVSSAPYHTPMHGRAWLRAIFTLSRHSLWQNTTPKCEVVVRLGHSIWRVHKWLFLWQKTDQNCLWYLQQIFQKQPQLGRPQKALSWNIQSQEQ